MSQIANIKYFTQKCNSVIGTSYSGGSWESTQAINMRWLCQAAQRVYNNIHTNQSSTYHTKLLSARFSNSTFLTSQDSLIACDTVIVDNVISYLLNFKGVCTCAMPSVPAVCGECAFNHCGECKDENVCGVCQSTCTQNNCNCNGSYSTCNCNCVGNCECNCTGICECNCQGECDCNCNCQCECTMSNCTNNPATFCQCNCTQAASNCVGDCECACIGVCECNCTAPCECQCNCNCVCACNCRPAH